MLTPYMTKGCFLQITGAMCYTNNQLPTFEGKFFIVNQMLCASNKHKKDNYTLSWHYCPDELMSSLLTPY